MLKRTGLVIKKAYQMHEIEISSNKTPTGEQ